MQHRLLVGMAAITAPHTNNGVKIVMTIKFYEEILRVQFALLLTMFYFLFALG